MTDTTPDPLRLAVDALAWQVLRSGPAAAQEPLWRAMRCAEVDALAAVFYAGGHPDVAERVIRAHARGDDDPSDLHHAQNPAF